MNNCTIMGRLTRDPEVRTTSTGNNMVTMSVAVNRRKKPDGTQDTDFFDAVAFGKLADVFAQYMHKGNQVLLNGRMESNRVEKDGQKRTYWSLMVDGFDFVGSKSDNQGGNQTGAPAYTPVDVPDDDLPF